MAQKKLDIDIKTILTAGLAVGAYFVVIKPIFSILETLNLKDTKKEKKEEKEAAENLKNQVNIWQGIEAVFTAGGRDGKTDYRILTKEDAQKYAKGIYNSLSWYNDNEDRIYSIFNGLKFQTQVAPIVDQYRYLYKADLYNVLKYAMSTSEFNEVLNIISKKEIGITKRK